jgi:hypothetical protein
LILFLFIFVLATSQFWIDVNKKVDTQINFSELEDCFKVNTENNNTALAAKTKATTVRNKFCF